MLGQKVARTTIGAIRAVAGSKKIQNGIVAPCKQNIGPTLSIIKNTTLEKSRECASNAQAFYQQKVEPQFQKAKSIAKTEYGKYKKEVKSSFETHAPLGIISELLPAKYKAPFIATMSPVSHIVKKAVKEREDFNWQKFKTEVGNELKATAMTEGALYCAKNIVKKLPPLQKTAMTVAICGTSHYLVNNEYINKEISRQKENLKKEKDKAIKKASEILNKRTNKNKGTTNSTDRGCRC